MTTGVRITNRNRGGTGKARRSNDLLKKDGKSSRRISTRKEVGQLPVAPQKPSHDSTASRHRSRSLEELARPLDSRTWLELARAHHGGASTVESRVNPFRRALEKLGPVRIEYGAVIESVSTRLVLAVKSQFLDGRTFLMQDLLRIAANGDGHFSGFYAAYRALVTEGRILTSVTGLAGSGATPHAFDLSSENPFARRTTLRGLLTAYVASGRPTREIEGAFQAVRILLALKQYSSRGEILKAAARIDDGQFFGLSRALSARMGIEATQSQKTKSNLKSALRRMLTWGLERDAFCLRFPEYRPADEWTSLIDECFPPGAGESRYYAIRQARSGLSALFRVAQHELHAPSPYTLDEAQIRKVLELLRAPQRHKERDRVRHLTKLMRRARGRWEHPVLQRVLGVLRGVHRTATLPLLGWAKEQSNLVGTFEGVIGLIESHRLSKEWAEFLTWYRDYSLISFGELRRRRNEFPSRPQVRQLSEDVFLGRLRSVRAFLGMAVELYPNDYRSLLPEDVFGVHFEDLWLRIMGRWRDAAAQSNGPSHEASSGLCKYLIDGGLIALALFDRSRFKHHMQAPQAAAAERTRAGGAGLQRRLLTAVRREGVLSDIELELLAAYEISRNDSTGLNRIRLTSPFGSGLNTEKDLRRLIKETPFVHFQRAQDWMVAHCETLVTCTTVAQREVDVWFTLAVANALLLSGGCRRGELCHLREGIQSNLGKGARDVHIRASDRKNRKPLDFAVRQRWAPDWLLEHYFAVVRPRVAARAGGTDSEFPFLLLNPTTGSPYGCAEENPNDGSGREVGPFRNRKSALAKSWVRRMAYVFDTLGFLVPCAPSSFGLHIVRNVGGHAVFVKHGLERAAAWLGDSVATVEGTYADLKGELVDTSLVD